MTVPVTSTATLIRTATTAQNQLKLRKKLTVERLKLGAQVMAPAARVTTVSLLLTAITNAHLASLMLPATTANQKVALRKNPTPSKSSFSFSDCC